MFSTVSNLPPVNIWVFAVAVVVVAYVSLATGRAAYRTPGQSIWKRSGRWVACALLSALGVSALSLGRWVPNDQIGVGMAKVYASGWHVYPAEPFVIVPRAGMFNIPYPDDRRFLEVSYLITDSDRLRYFCEEIKAFKTPVGQGLIYFGASRRDAWKVENDPFAAWISWKTRKYLPSELATSAELEGYLSYLAGYGISTDVRLLVQQWHGKR